MTFRATPISTSISATSLKPAATNLRRVLGATNPRSNTSSRVSVTSASNRWFPREPLFLTAWMHWELTFNAFSAVAIVGTSSGIPVVAPAWPTVVRPVRIGSSPVMKFARPAVQGKGTVYALDATTGKDLWHFPGNEVSYANPVSYLSNGKQQVAIAIGDVLMAFGLD